MSVIREYSLTPKQYEDLQTCCDNTCSEERKYREYIRENLHKDDQEEFLDYARDISDETDRIYEYLSKVSVKSSD